MRKSVSSVVVAILIALACQCDADKITVDPNASRGGEAGSAISDKSPDARLAREISYEATHKPLKVILSELSTVTGVELNAGVSKSDWQVRDRKMSVFVNDLPLAALMSSIARVMKFKWTVNGDKNPPTYRLVMDRKSIGKMEEENSRKQEELKREIILRRHKLIDTFAKVAAMSNQEIANLQDENPYLYFIGKTGLAKLTTAIFNECPRIRDTWADMRRNMCPPASLLSPATKELFLQVMRANYPYRKWSPDAVLPADAANGFDTHDLVMENVVRPFSDWERSQLNNYGGLGCFTDKGFFHLGYYLDPDSSGAKAQAKTALGVVDERKSSEQAEADSGIKEASEKDTKSNDEYLLIEPQTEHEPDTDLQKKVKLKIDKLNLRELGPVLQVAAVQRAMSEASGFNIVSDSFARFDGSIDTTDGEKEFQPILDCFARGIGDNWEKRGTVIEMHNRDWFRKRSAQIPDEWIERWRASLKKTGTLTLDEFCQILVLTIRQLEENILTDPVLKCCSDSPQGWNLINQRGLARFYVRLDTNQRAMVFTPDGLPLDSLNPDQWQAANAMLDDPYSSWNMDTLIEEAHGRFCMRATTRKRNDGTLEYRFALRAQDPDVKPRVGYAITMPKYVEPKKTEAPGTGDK